MADSFGKFPSSLESPAKYAFAITPSDADDLAMNTRAIYVGGAGNLRVILAGDTTAVTFTAVPVGTVLNIRVKKVMSTSTTATALVGLY